jgi:hypothetical protein
MCTRRAAKDDPRMPLAAAVALIVALMKTVVLKTKAR